MITTNDEALGTRMRATTNHGIVHEEVQWPHRHRYDVRWLGVKAVLPDPLAALELGQLEEADRFHRRRAQIARYYRHVLEPSGFFELPAPGFETKSSWHLFVLRLRLERLTIDRDELVRTLAARGVACSVHFRPLHLHAAYRALIAKGRVVARELKVCEREWKRVVSLPIYPALTDDEATAVCERRLEVCRDAARS